MRTGPSRRRIPLVALACVLTGGTALLGSAPAGAGATSGATAAQPGTPRERARAARTVEQFQRSCVLCHVTGEGGAPRMGDAAAWTLRVAQGETVLLQHAIEGYRNMPPLGYCQDCEAGDFRALIEFMSRGAAGQDAEPAHAGSAAR